MARNESVARMVMLLCFGTASLSLAVHWRITTTEWQLGKPSSNSLQGDSTLSNFQGSRSEGAYKNLSKAGLGEVALGAPVPPNEPTRSSTTQQIFTSKSKSERISKNVAKTTDQLKKTRLVEQKQTENPTLGNRLKLFLSQTSAPKALSGKVVSEKTQVVVDLSDRRVYVYAKDEVIASYPLAIGKKGWETPTGTFKVTHMQHHPIWRHPITGKVFEAGTDSPLGDRWIGFWSDGRNVIGFHGTPDTDLLGMAVSHGCLRMRNPDVRMLYDQVGLGTSVVVRE